MNKIKLNNFEAQVENYTKNVTLIDNEVISTASIGIRTENREALLALLKQEISTIQIYVEEELIYNMQNAQGTLETISEYLNENKMNITLTLSFNT